MSEYKTITRTLSRERNYCRQSSAIVNCLLSKFQKFAVHPRSVSINHHESAVTRGLTRERDGNLHSATIHDPPCNSSCNACGVKISNERREQSRERARFLQRGQFPEQPYLRCAATTSAHRATLHRAITCWLCETMVVFAGERLHSELSGRASRPCETSSCSGHTATLQERLSLQKPVIFLSNVSAWVIRIDWKAFRRVK